MVYVVAAVKLVRGVLFVFHICPSLKPICSSVKVGLVVACDMMCASKLGLT